MADFNPGSAAKGSTTGEAPQAIRRVPAATTQRSAEIYYSPIRRDINFWTDPSETGAPPKKRAFCNGVYDLCHLGHMLLFEKIALLLRDENIELIVGVHGDEACKDYKRVPVVNEMIRYNTVMHCKHVDGIIENTPLVTDAAFVKHYKIDFVCIGEEYKNAGDYKWYPGPIDMGIQRYIPRHDEISTSKLIKNISDSCLSAHGK